MMGEFRWPLFVVLVLVVAGMACGGSGEGATEVSPTETTQGPPDEVVRYVTKVSEQGLLLNEALEDIWELSQQPKIDDEEWTLNMAVQIVVVQSVHQVFTEMDVPADMEEVHAALLDGTRDCDMSMDFLAQGVDALDPELLEMGAGLMESCLTKTAGARDMVADYLAQFE